MRPAKCWEKMPERKAKLKFKAAMQLKQRASCDPALIQACQSGLVGEAARLLERTNPAFRDVSNTGEFPLTAAIRNGHWGVVSMLLECDERVRTTVNVRTRDGFTPLQLSLITNARLHKGPHPHIGLHSNVHGDALKCVEMLLHYGAQQDPFTRTSDSSLDGKLPVEIALETGQTQIVLLLLSAKGSGDVLGGSALAGEAQAETEQRLAAATVVLKDAERERRELQEAIVAAGETARDLRDELSAKNAQMLKNAAKVQASKDQLGASELADGVKSVKALRTDKERVQSRLAEHEEQLAQMQKQLVRAEKAVAEKQNKVSGLQEELEELQDLSQRRLRPEGGGALAPPAKDAAACQEHKLVELVFLAASQEDQDAARQCLSHMLQKRRLDVNRVHLHGVSLLLHTLRLHRLHTARYLLAECGANASGGTLAAGAQDHLVWQAAALMAPGADSEALMILLVRHGIRVNVSFQHAGRCCTPLTLAIQEHRDGLLHVLLEAKADVAPAELIAGGSESQGLGGEQPLGTAIRTGRWDVMHALLSSSSRTLPVRQSVNAPDREGLAPLVSALLTCHRATAATDLPQPCQQDATSDRTDEARGVAAAGDVAAAAMLRLGMLQCVSEIETHA